MRRCAAVWLALLLASTGAAAQRYPSKPIRIVVAFAPGGAVDIVTRTVGQKIGEQVGQPVVVDNRPGGNANIGATMVAKATPDGYTLLTASGANVVNNMLFPDLLYKTGCATSRRYRRSDSDPRCSSSTTPCR